MAEKMLPGSSPKNNNGHRSPTSLLPPPTTRKKIQYITSGEDSINSRLEHAINSIRKMQAAFTSLKSPLKLRTTRPSITQDTDHARENYRPPLTTGRSTPRTRSYPKPQLSPERSFGRPRSSTFARNINRFNRRRFSSRMEPDERNPNLRQKPSRFETPRKFDYSRCREVTKNQKQIPHRSRSREKRSPSPRLPPNLVSKGSISFRSRIQRNADRGREVKYRQLGPDKKIDEFKNFFSSQMEPPVMADPPEEPLKLRSEERSQQDTEDEVITSKPVSKNLGTKSIPNVLLGPFPNEDLDLATTLHHGDTDTQEKRENGSIERKTWPSPDSILEPKENSVLTVTKVSSELEQPNDEDMATISETYSSNSSAGETSDMEDTFYVMDETQLSPITDQYLESARSCEESSQVISSSNEDSNSATTLHQKDGENQEKQVIGSIDGKTSPLPTSLLEPEENSDLTVPKVSSELEEPDDQELTTKSVTFSLKSSTEETSNMDVETTAHLMDEIQKNAITNLDLASARSYEESSQLIASSLGSPPTSHGLTCKKVKIETNQADEGEKMLESPPTSDGVTCSKEEIAETNQADEGVIKRNDFLLFILSHSAPTYQDEQRTAILPKILEYFNFKKGQK